MADKFKYNPLIKSGFDITGTSEQLSKADIDDALSATSENPVQNKVITAELQAICDHIEELHYVAIAVSSFSVNPSVAEKGSIVTSVQLAWVLNKTPKNVTVESVERDAVKSGNITIDNLNLQAAKTFNIKATDEKAAVANKTTTLQFFNGVYWGAKPAQEGFDSSFILSLSKNLQNSRAKTFTVNAGENEYIYYALPTNMGTCNFNVGGFDGGFKKVKTLSFTNASGYTEDYDIYRSDNANLGNTTVKVS